MSNDLLYYTSNGRHLENLIGQRFGKLVVTGYHGKNARGKRTWVCLCDCGNIVVAQTSLLKYGKVKSCGCYKYDVIDHYNPHTGKTTKIKNFAGKRFGMLTAVEPTLKKIGTNIVWKFRCDCGRECEAEPSKLSKYSNCGCRPEEALHRKNLIVGENDLASTHPELVAEWDYSKNKIMPQERTAGSNERIFWLCSKGHSYKMSIVTRTGKGQGCPYCGGYKVYAGLNDFATNHPELLCEWDYEKNKILPSDVTKCCDKAIHWICPSGHQYQKKISVRVNQSIGCPYCTNMKTLKGFNDIESVHPELLKYWDYEKNGSILPSDVTYVSKKKVWWKCDKGHSYEQAIDNKLRQNQGCPYCANLKVLKGYNDLASQAPDIAIEWDYSKNEKKPDEYTVGSYSRVWWKCLKCGNEWKTVIGSRTREKQGCPRCAFTYQTSLQEQIVFYYIKKIFPDAVNSYKAEFLGKREIDIYIPSIRLGIEYDGHVAHNNTERDKTKTELLLENGIFLVRFRDERLAAIDDDSYCINVDRHIDRDASLLTQPLMQLLFFISSKYGINCDWDVDIMRDLSDILSMYECRKKANSLAASGKDIVSEWNHEKNGSLTPEMITYGSKKVVWWKCSFCGKEWQMSVISKKGLGCEKCRRRAGHEKALINKREYEVKKILAE